MHVSVYSKHQSFKNIEPESKWLLKDVRIFSSHRFAFFELTYFFLPGRVVSDVSEILVFFWMESCDLFFLSRLNVEVLLPKIAEDEDMMSENDFLYICIYISNNLIA